MMGYQQNNAYAILKQQCFSKGKYSIVPIRYEDRLHIMKWRNEQIYHLRQTRPLTVVDQDNYFKNTINAMFTQEKPTDILFSYLEKGECIGYGGLVHIDWTNKNAEISFIMDTSLEEKSFDFNWSTYLELLEQAAFNDLNLHKIYTYAFDLRPYLYKVLEKSNYIKEAVLTEHCFFADIFVDVVIHSKLNNNK